MKISLDLLLALDAIDRHGSFSAAAAALHRVPSALSHAIARLESDLGLSLFERQGRRAVLNAAGRALLEDGRLLLRSAQEIERRVQRIASGWEAELRLAVDAVLPLEPLFPLIERFHAAGHATEIRLMQEVLGGSWDALATGRADLVIGAPGDRPARGGIDSRLLGEARLIFVVSPQHPLAAHPEPIPQAELVHHRAVVIADTSRELGARTVGLLEGQPRLLVPSMTAKAAAQVAGLGIGHLPRWLAEPEIAAGRLCQKTLAESRPAMPCHLAWRSRELGQAGRWFIDAVSQPATREALLAAVA